MTRKALRFHRDAREGVCAGLNVLANAVKVTLGPKGRLVMIERSYGAPTIINSGVAVARARQRHAWREDACARGHRGTGRAPMLARARLNSR